MIYKTSYDSPLGSLLLLADEKGLTGLWFEKQKHFAYGRTGFEADAADWIFISRGKSLILTYQLTCQEPSFRRKSGRFYAQSPTVRP